MTDKKLFILQINEVNFDLVKKYVNKYNFPNLKKLITNFNFIETSSETKYENLEPWIQWVSFYTGKTAEEHKVFHLNDTNQNIQTFYKKLEKSNKLSFMFPMNLKNNFNNDTLFLPDPWTDTTKSTKSNLLNKFYDISKKLILQNQKIKLNFSTIITVTLVYLNFTSFKGKIQLLKIAAKSISRKYYKALFFDYLISEIFLHNIYKQKTNINTIFFNAAAHIQHHYLLSSEFYKDKFTNHSFIRKDDPLLACYGVYDEIIGRILRQKESNFFFATGLSQTAIEKPIYYWNFKDHNNFFSYLKIPFEKINKRMSRDYTLFFKNSDDLDRANNILRELNIKQKKIFSLEVKNNKIYLEFIYDEVIEKNDNLYDKNNKIVMKNILNEVNFVAVKNSIHNQKGYVYTDLKINVKKLNIKDFYNYFIENYA